MSHDCDNFTGSMGCLVTMIALLQLGELLQKKYQQVFPLSFLGLLPPSTPERLPPPVPSSRPMWSSPSFWKPTETAIKGFMDQKR